MSLKQRVLLVEDDILMSKMIKYRLEKEDYEVTLSEDGETALDFIESESYSAIITDLMLPSLSGMELLDEIKKRQVSCPVLVLTSLSADETNNKARKLGAVDFITKPVKPDDLVVRLQHAINKDS